MKRVRQLLQFVIQVMTEFVEQRAEDAFSATTLFFLAVRIPERNDRVRASFAFKRSDTLSDERLRFMDEGHQP